MLAGIAYRPPVYCGDVRDDDGATSTRATGAGGGANQRLNVRIDRRRWTHPDFAPPVNPWRLMLRPDDLTPCAFAFA
jgi:hypothetical protein